MIPLNCTGLSDTEEDGDYNWRELGYIIQTKITDKSKEIQDRMITTNDNLSHRDLLRELVDYCC